MRCVVNIIGFTIESCQFFWNLIASLSCTLHQSILDTKYYPFSSGEINFWHQQSIILLSDWLVLNILVISTRLGAWLVNCIRFNSIICEFTLWIQNISLALFLEYKNILISDIFYRDFLVFFDTSDNLCALRLFIIIII